MEATFVLYAPPSKRDWLRETLAARLETPLRWRERKGLFGSEFYLTGPAAQARKAHSALTETLAWA